MHKCIEYGAKYETACIKLDSYSIALPTYHRDSKCQVSIVLSSSPPYKPLIVYKYKFNCQFPTNVESKRIQNEGKVNVVIVFSMIIVQDCWKRIWMGQKLGLCNQINLQVTGTGIQVK